VVKDTVQPLQSAQPKNEGGHIEPIIAPAQASQSNSPSLPTASVPETISTASSPRQLPAEKSLVATAQTSSGKTIVEEDSILSASADQQLSVFPENQDSTQKS